MTNKNTVNVTAESDEVPSPTQGDMGDPITVEGTPGRIAKFATATTITDSIITESADKIGIGHDSPPSKLTVFSTDPGTPAIFGQSDSNTGVHGHSGSGNGVAGRSIDGNGVAGTTNTSVGVFGHSTTTTGVGVFGSSDGVGVIGSSTNFPGVFGSSTSNNGVAGLSNSRNGVFGSSSTGNGVEGFSINGAGTVGVSNTGPGVSGQSTSGRGINGVSNTGPGTVGVSNTGPGVSGQSTSGRGINGFSNTGPGVVGRSLDSAGVIGQSVTGTGVRGISSQGFAGLFEGRVRVTGFLTKGGGGFEIDHPLDPGNKYLCHSFVESPDMLNVYNGNVTTDANGEASVTLPAYFEALNQDFRYQLTVIGQFAQAIVAQEIRNNQFTIKTDQPHVKVSWQVTGIRKDPWAVANRITAEEEKAAEDKGRYLHPELWGQPEEAGVHRIPLSEPSLLEEPPGIDRVRLQEEWRQVEELTQRMHQRIPWKEGEGPTSQESQ